MKPEYEYGDEVRLTRNVRNDGTYPGKEIGEMLIRRGSIGCVFDVGTYLQDQLIYRVHFLDQNKTVGCRGEELIPADAPWIDNKFEFREKVILKYPLTQKGEEIAPAGYEGEIEKVVRTDESLIYHVRVMGRTFQMPEILLEEPPQETATEEVSAEESAVQESGQ